MLQKELIWKELERFNVVVDEAVDASLLVEDLPSLLEITGIRTNAQQPYVQASVLMRHIAFVFTAQLFALSSYRLKWTGSVGRVGLVDKLNQERWSPHWVFAEGNWVSLGTNEDVASALKEIICRDCHEIVVALARATHSSQLVLWENVWGYVLWMYVQLLKQPGEISERAQNDLNILLDTETWKGVRRTSPFKQFLCWKSPEEAMANFTRVTCCLYYQAPGNEKCPYCPKNDKCTPER